MILPTVNEERTSLQVTEVFGGYNHNLKIADGEFYEMENLTSAKYPLLSNRSERGTAATLTNPQGIITKDALIYVDNGKVYINGHEVAGVSLDTTTEKQLVSMGAYLVIFPDKYYINTADTSDHGPIENKYTSVSGSNISYTLCRNDGTVYDGIEIKSATPPQNPTDGMFWIDISGDVSVLKQYSATSEMWVTIPTVYVKISCTGIGVGFKKFDGVNISGCTYSGDDTSVEKQISDLNGSHIIYERGDNFIVIVGIIDEAYEQRTGSISVARTVPEMDFVTEAQNRLWGCKYGILPGIGTVNEIYCCALGDFKNWEQYLGLSTDSYRASVGTDGQWTGAITHLGYPLFFKENCMHKVYVSSSGAHQIKDTACRGVQKGSDKSLAIVNETLFYKSRSGVCAYDGSLPVGVDEAFGDIKYYNAVGGSLGSKYYISMKDSPEDATGKWHLFVFDFAKNMWHREDNTHALFFTTCDEELFYVDADSKKLIAENGSSGVLEGKVKWSAKTGIMGFRMTVSNGSAFLEGTKYVSRFNLRMKLPEGSYASIYIEYDSDGEWHECGHLYGSGMKTFNLPVRPRRCDRFRIWIKGEGDIRIYSFTRVMEAGSDD